MGLSKRYLEDISQTIGFDGDINERVNETSKLLADLFHSDAVEGDYLRRDSRIGGMIQRARNELKGLTYYDEPKLYFSKLRILLTEFTFEELLEYYHDCVKEWVGPMQSRLAWLIIRNTHRHRALIHKVTTDTIQFSPAGGGFVQEVKRDIARLEYVDKFPRNWVAGFFQIEDDTIYQGFHDPEARWNGWAMPYFTRKTANAIVAEIPAFEDGKPYGYFEGDICFIWDYGLEDYESYKPTSLEGVDELVYGIGAGSWVWDSVEESEYEYQESGSEVSYDEFLEDRRGF